MCPGLGRVTNGPPASGAGSLKATSGVLLDLPSSGKLSGEVQGAGPKIAPPTLKRTGMRNANGSNPLKHYNATQELPVSYQSGTVHRVRLRTQCNLVLRFSIHLWADRSRQACPWANTYYQALRNRANLTLRFTLPGPALAQMLSKMWQTRTFYDAELHQQN